MAKKFISFFNDYISTLITSIQNTNYENIQQASDLILKTVKRNNTIFVCGNGGSASVANHFLCDFNKSLRLLFDKDHNLEEKIFNEQFIL